MSNQLLEILARLAHHQHHKEGYLEKLGQFNSITWKTRYFVLRGSCLYYFISKEDLTRPKGAIDLIGASLTADVHSIHIKTMKNGLSLSNLPSLEKLT
jgi:hypothetical protein